MKSIYRFTGSALIAGALSITPVTTAIAGQSTQSPPSGTQSGQGVGGTGSGTGTGTGSGTAQADRDRAKNTSQGAVSGADRTFMLDAMAGNKAEVELATLAADKASSATVKELARTIQQHHTEANTKLQALAGGGGAADGGPAVKPAHKQLHAKLSKLEGAAFDQAYAAEMVKEHQKDIAKYEKASTQLQHSGLKAYATDTLPHLKQHLQKAREAGNARGTH